MKEGRPDCRSIFSSQPDDDDEGLVDEFLDDDEGLVRSHPLIPQRVQRHHQQQELDKDRSSSFMDPS